MISPFKYQWQKSLTFAVYGVIVLLILNPFSFVAIHNTWFALILACALFISGDFMLLTYTSGFEPKKKLMMRTLGSMLLTLFAGFIVWLIFKGETENLSLYIIAFLVLSIPVSAFRILIYLMGTLKINNVEIEESAKIQEQKIQFTNEAGKILLSVMPSQIICFEANDNYTVTYYLSVDNELKKSMERISLKKIEEILVPVETEFHRVHKSYIVNPIFIEKISGKSQAYKLNISYLNSPIPVSRQFDISVLQA